MNAVPAPLLAEHARRQVVVLDLRGGQAAPPELVLEALDAKARVRPVGDEARDPGVGVGKREEDLEDRVGAEPLVSGQLVPAVADGLGDSGIRAQVGPALLLGEGHARLGEAVVIGQRHALNPLRRQCRVLPHRRHRRVVDREGTAWPGVELVEEMEHARSHHVCAVARLPPRQRVHLTLDAQAQHPVHRRVVLDLVDPVAVAVVRAQYRDVALGALGVLQRLGRAEDQRRARERARGPTRRLRGRAPAAGRRRRQTDRSPPAEGAG